MADHRHCFDPRQSLVLAKDSGPLRKQHEWQRSYKAIHACKRSAGSTRTSRTPSDESSQGWLALSTSMSTLQACWCPSYSVKLCFSLGATVPPTRQTSWLQLTASSKASNPASGYNVASTFQASLNKRSTWRGHHTVQAWIQLSTSGHS